MRKRILNWQGGILLLSVLFCLRASAQLPAFPGAQGAAGTVSGGRNGIVYHVTKLNTELDDPNRAAAGTFLYGINNANFPAGPRTIVFDVAGVFHLGKVDTTNWTSGGNAWDSASRQGISANNLTIAGQTAPGPVIFMGGTLKLQGTNQIYRNLTIAAGYGMKGFWEPPNAVPTAPLPTSFTMDAIEVNGQHVMLDHCSAYFATDEAASCNEVANNLTMQYCNFGRSQNYQAHGFGHLLQAGSNNKISFLNNLDAHVGSRVPRIGSEVGTGPWNDFRNSVVYNWIGNLGGYAGDLMFSYNNFINDFMISGPGGETSTNTTSTGSTQYFNGANTNYTFVFLSGSVKDSNKDGDLNDEITMTSSAGGSANEFRSVAPLPTAMDVDIGVTLSARAALTNVLRYAGARWWERDYDFATGNTNAVDNIDERLAYETYTCSGKIYAWAYNPFNVGASYFEWTNMWNLRMDTNGAAPFNRPAGWDTDQDGMPDYWELQHGLDPNVADNNGDFDNDGYSNLEEYLNEIAAWPAPGIIYFNGTNTSRYAEIFNWQVNGVALNITNKGVVTTYSMWQPSKYDTAVISNSTVVVDSVGQHAGTLRMAMAGANNATLNITNGWLKVTNTLEIAKAGTGTVNLSGGKLRVGTLTNGGGTATFNFTGGTLAADKVTFSVNNQGGTLSPGDSPGTTHITGNLTQDSASTLAIEVNGTNAGQFDRVIVDGTATIDGALTVTFTNGYAPAAGTVLTILTSASRSGTFSSTNLPLSPPVEVIYTATSVQLKIGNNNPVLPAIGSQVANEQALFSYNAAATDPDVPSSQTLTYSLTNSPVGASVDANGLVTWTPTESEGGTVTNITVLVSDNGTPVLSDSRTFQITVNDVNAAPNVPAISDQVLDEQTLLSINVSATDGDVPGQTLSYSLTNSPSGASVDSGGLITWTPIEADGPRVTNITVRVTDNGSPNLTSTRTFQVTVNEVNTRPTLGALSDKTLNAGAILAVTNMFSDGDIPANALSFSLLAAPSGASVNGSGVVSWRPTVAQANTTNVITVQLMDNGTPNYTTNQSFQVVVNPLGLVTLTAVTRTNGTFLLRVNGDVGPDYTILGSTTLTNWSTLTTTNPTATPFDYYDGSGTNNRFYRVLIGP